MGSYTAYYNSCTYGRSCNTAYTSFTGTMQLPLANGDKDSDPCEAPIAVSPIEQPNTITASSGGIAEGTGEFILQVPEVGSIEPATSIMLRPISGGVELLGCNNTEYDYGASQVERDDSYYIEREVNSWIVDYILDFPIAKYACGVIGDKIYFFGGIKDNTREGTNGFYVYDITKKTITELDNGGITLRTDAYGLCMGGEFYVYGGYTYSGYSAGFINEFWKWNGSGWVSLQPSSFVNNPPVTNKIIGGHGYIYISNAMTFDGGGNWINKKATYRYNTFSDSWTIPYDMLEYPATGYINFEAFCYHKGIIYYFNREVLMQILPDQKHVTAGVTIPSLNHNPMIASYGNYLIFTSGVSDGGTSQTNDLSWFDTESRFTGTFDVVGAKPPAMIGFDPMIIDGVLYQIGGIIPVANFLLPSLYESRIWKIDLKEFFRKIDTTCANGVPPDTYLEKINGMCKEYAGHPCGTTYGEKDGSYVSSKNDPFSPDYVPS